MGIGDTTRRVLEKLILRTAGYQVKIACNNLKLCTRLESGIEGATHTMQHSWEEREKEWSTVEPVAGGSGNNGEMIGQKEEE